MSYVLVDDAPAPDSSSPPSSGEYPDSGPYCRHGDEAWQCPELCGACGDACPEHGDIGCTAERVDGFDCECVSWVEGGTAK